MKSDLRRVHDLIPGKYVNQTHPYNIVNMLLGINLFYPLDSFSTFEISYN